MADDGAAQSAGFSNMFSLAISVLALIASLAALYWQFWRGPMVRAYQPDVVYLGRSQVGIPVAFTNGGTAADVVVAGSLDLTPNPAGSGEPFKLAWVSAFERKRAYHPDETDENKKWVSVQPEYDRFSHLPIKAGDTSAEIFWFEPQYRATFAFQPVSYRACGRFWTTGKKPVSAATKLMQPLSQDCSFAVQFVLSQSDLDTLKAQDEVEVNVK